MSSALARKRVTGIGFRDGNNDDYLPSRLRISMSIHATVWLKFQFQGQDARAFWNRRIPAAPPFEETMNPLWAIPASRKSRESFAA